MADFTTARNHPGSLYPVMWYSHTLFNEVNSSFPLNTFDDVLEYVRAESGDVEQLGKIMVKLSRDFLATDSMYHNRFKNVWSWSEWPGRDGNDAKIDMIARQHDGQLCAILCRCYETMSTLDIKSVEEFLAMAASLKITNTILVYTGDPLTGDTENLIKYSGCSVLDTDKFRYSGIDWSAYPEIKRKEPKELWPHQQDAISGVLEGFKKNDRGKLIMACGTGKTITALRIAERYAGPGSLILYAVPSISLVQQSMRAWSDNADMQHNYIAVCSDQSLSEDSSITELESEVTTDYSILQESLKRRPRQAMTVVFSTYHSLDVVKDAMGKRKFDIILADEAHRTTGVEDKSSFTMIHEDRNISGRKRLYMTATPSMYSDTVKVKTDSMVYSMDDESKFGPQFYHLGFTDAVSRGILADFRVKIAVVPQVDTTGSDDVTVPLDERTLLSAVWHGLNYPDDDENKPRLLKKVIAFTNRIDRSMMFAGAMSDHEGRDRSMARIVEQYESMAKLSTGNSVQVSHVDGKTGAMKRRDRLQWLDDNDRDDTCRIISNARCLSEGVDVPALDGVIFLNPRKSWVDVIQSVGRVMRKSPGKQYGYVILPVALPAGVKFHEALNDNKTFKVVWQVLNALRSHDESLAHEVMLNSSNGNTSSASRISTSILGVEDSGMVGGMFTGIKSKLVEKVGDINDQVLSAAAIRMETNLRDRMTHDEHVKSEMERFRGEVEDLVSYPVTQDAAVRAVSQYAALSPVLDSLFSGYVSPDNPLMREFARMMVVLGLGGNFSGKASRETKPTGSARQSYIQKMCGNFLGETCGIVNVPVPVIEFIINSVNHILKRQFEVALNHPYVKVLEPFAVTGSFMARLIESRYMNYGATNMYGHNLYANQSDLLAYCVSRANIETVYQNRNGGVYVPFGGMGYADTLAMDSPIPPRYRQPASSIATLSPYEKIESLAPPDQLVIMGSLFHSGTGHSGKKSEAAYIRALRWASDSIEYTGIIAVVTDASFIDAGVAQKLLHKKFTNVWCVKIPGDMFITILVKNYDKATRAVRYKEMGMDEFKETKSVDKIQRWKIVKQDKSDREFESYMPMSKKRTRAVGNSVFRLHSLGLYAQRDLWLYNSSKSELVINMASYISYCINPLLPGVSRYGSRPPYVLDRLDQSYIDPELDRSLIRRALYRPFFKRYVYFDTDIFINKPHEIPSLFPRGDDLDRTPLGQLRCNIFGSGRENLVIMVTQKTRLSVLVTDTTPDSNVLSNVHCFPYYTDGAGTENILDSTLARYRGHYNDDTITKLDIFHYVYGLLHHEGYRKRFKDSLLSNLPRIPMAPNFDMIAQYGKRLVDLHLNYETGPRYSLEWVGPFDSFTEMSLSGSYWSRKSPQDRLMINGNVVVKGIPEITYSIGGRTPLEWAVDQYRVKVNKKALVIDDPCTRMTQDDVIALVERMVYVGVESGKIIKEISMLPYKARR